MSGRGRGGRARGANRSVDTDMSIQPELGEDLVKCAACQAEMMSFDFDGHNLEVHNLLAWREGGPALDLTNEKMVCSLLNKILKGAKKKALACDTCNELKKSAVGYFTHKQVCGKTKEEIENLKVSCEVCGKSMMPVSLRPHMQAHERNAAMEAEIGEEVPEKKKGKRVAAKKAKSKMIEFLSDAGASGDLSPTKTPRRSLLYTRLSDAIWRPPAKLVNTWKRVIDQQGMIKCPCGGCMYETFELDSLRIHIPECQHYNSSEQVYLCNVCLLQTSVETDMEEHVQAEHETNEARISGGSSSEMDSDSDAVTSETEGDGPKKRSSKSKIKPPVVQRSFGKLKFLIATPQCRDLEVYPAAFQWTLEFRTLNYSELLFNGIRTNELNWTLLKEDAKAHLPNLSKSVSVEFHSQGQPARSEDNQCRRFSPFSGDIVEGVSTMFTGGPVWAMAWCPIPSETCLSEDSPPDQFLAISGHHRMDDIHFAQKCYSTPNIIQLWNCGPLVDDHPSQAPQLALAIAHDYGTVWDLAWCPSGVYESSEMESKGKIPQLKRLGLLAAACSDGSAIVFSIPHPSQLTAHSNYSVLPVYKCSPSLTLIADFPEPSQCTRLSWYGGKGHRLIAGSFCNGIVALWDVESSAPLLWEASTKTLRPYHVFQAHISVITALSFNPEYDGRYLMTGSHDRSVKFWDLEDTTTHLTVHRKGIVTDGIWLGHWVSGVASYDDALLHEHTNSTIQPVRDYGYKPYPLLTQNSVAWSLSFNEWTNAVAQGSEAGEIVITCSNQLLSGLENEKNTIDRRMMLSYTLLKELVMDDNGKEKHGGTVMWQPDGGSKGNSKAKGKSKGGKQAKAASGSSEQTPAEELKPRTYDAALKKYGIAIHDTVQGRYNKTKLPADALSRVRLSSRMHAAWSDLFPIMSINKVAWNPNIGSFLWLASGHQCGIVRIISAHFMENSTMKKFISSAKVGMNECD